MKLGPFEFAVSYQKVGYSTYDPATIRASKRVIGAQWGFEIGTRKQDHRRKDEKAIWRRLFG